MAVPGYQILISHAPGWREGREVVMAILLG